MPLFADNFLSGAILSLVLPAGVLIVIAVWYALTVRRMAQPELSTPEQARSQPESGAGQRAPESPASGS